MNNQEIIYLEYLLQDGNPNLSLQQASQELGENRAILNCHNVDNLTREQLDRLFQCIPQEWQDTTEIYRFIDIDSLSPSLAANIANYVNEPNFSPTSPNSLLTPALLGMGIAVSIIFLLFLGERFYRFSTGTRVEKDKYTLGILYTPKAYQALEEYLEKSLIVNDFWKFLRGHKVRIVVEGDRQLRYTHAKNRIKEREWDIAFTLSPMLSSFSKNNGYTFAARMFPDRPPYYQSALFVKADSSIDSLNDIQPSTVVALGETISASSFFMPVYELYGKTFTVNAGNRGQDIVRLVKRGEADIGAAAYGDSVTKDKDIRVLHLSRDIPGSGVYISPSLSQGDRETLSKVLLSAPTDVKESANYDGGKEPEYGNFLRIVDRVDKIIDCVDLNQNPVRFFCSPDQVTARETITGKINGIKLLSPDRLLIILENDRKQTYRVTIDSSWIDKLPSIQGDILKLYNRQVEINNIIPRMGEQKEFEIDRIENFKVR
jgi:serine/threonine-protein kinase